MDTPPTQDAVLSASDALPESLASPCHETSEANAAGCAATGGVSAPRLVTRGESHPGESTALIDWLSFTVPPAGEFRGWTWLRDCLRDIFGIPHEAWNGGRSGYAGYKHRVDLKLPPGQWGESVSLGLVAWGGESQHGTLHASLNAQACARIKNWQLVMEWAESVGAVITRVDCAHDDFEGITLSIDQALKWFDEGFFSMNGRPPAAELINDLNSGKGKTLYIGSRQNGKLVRVYEKGKKEGDPVSLWVRAEVELHNKSRVIPWDILMHPEHYLAGAYPCLAYLSEVQCRIKTVRKSATINYQKMVSNTRTSAGKALNAMLAVEGNPVTVIELIRRDGIPKRLEPCIGFDGVLVGGKDGISHT